MPAIARAAISASIEGARPHSNVPNPAECMRISHDFGITRATHQKERELAAWHLSGPGCRTNVLHAAPQLNPFSPMLWNKRTVERSETTY